MSRMQRFDWQQKFSPRTAARRKLRQPSPLTRRLRIETLEDRRLLAAVSVTNDFDVVDGDTSSIASLIASPGADGISLREAIEAANADASADIINISFGGSILLTQGELVITNSLTISGPNTGTLTINASGNDPTPGENNGDGSRVFNIDDGDDGNLLEVFLEDLRITGGDVMGEGGGIRSRENLVLVDSSIVDNSTSSELSFGGGISIQDGNLTVIDSLISGNSTNGRLSSGGGIFSDSSLTVSGSTISDNSTNLDYLAYLPIAPTSGVISAALHGGFLGANGGGIRAGTLLISNSTVSGNSTLSNGGGIFVADDLEVIGSTISGNSAIDGGGGIFATRDLEVIDSTISRNVATGYFGRGGGGIYAGGDTSISSSTISENFTSGISAMGGGISVKSPPANGSINTLTITDSTISDNSTTGDSASGGGIASSFSNTTIIASAIYGNSTTGREADGGGISASFTGILQIVDSTISGNEATGEISSGGGISFFAVVGRGELLVSHSTITGNRATESGGGVLGLSLITHSIVSGNWLVSEGQPPVADDISGNGTILGYSLIGTIDGTFTETPGSVNYFGIDPLLGALADNGGPTKTHALLAGSPAIDAGDPAIASAPLFDQRGNPFRRLSDGNGDFIQQIDIGSYEVPTTFVVTTQVDELDGLAEFNSASGLLSLREAMHLANMIPRPTNITFAPSLSGTTILVDQAGLGPLPTITDNVTIDATNLPGGLTIDAGYGLDGTPETGDGIRVFDIDNSYGSLVRDDDSSLLDITLSGLTLTGGDVTGEGGGIRSRENLRIFDSSITGNSTSGNNFYSETYKSGGGVSSRIGDLTVIDSTVSDNSTQGRAADGGGIYSNTNLTVINSTISGNATRFDSPQYQSSLTSAAIVSAPHRSSGAYGGGIQARNLVITDSTVSGNFTLSRFGFGGGISAGNLTMTNTTVDGNSTAGDDANGGGISLRAIDASSITDSTISDNSTSGLDAQGGGIAVASISSGGSASVKGVLKITNSAISGNSTTGDFSGGGGGIHVQRTKLDVIASKVYGNSTVGERAYGGGIYSSLADLTISTSTIYNNRTSGEHANGGGINALGGMLSVFDSTISGNAVTGESASGGGIHAPQKSGRGELNISHSTITDNRATKRGGGIELLDSQLSHAIISGNWLTSDGQPPVADDISGNGFGTELSYNLIGTITGDFTETPGSVNYFGIDPLLGPLADNGGPTKTHALLFGSPAIDAGDPSIAFDANEFDQRGIPFQRVADGNGNGTQQIDIGAVEAPTTLVVTTAIDEFDDAFDPGVGNGFSLREAMTAANSIPPETSINIVFAAFLKGQTIDIDQLNLGALPTIVRNVSINASTVSGGITIDAGYGLDGTPDTGDGIRVFDIDDEDDGNILDVGLFGLTITGGDIMGEGGGIRSRENLTVVDSSITGNSTSGEDFSGYAYAPGGGISSRNSDLAIINSSVTDNSTFGRIADGGGIYSNTYLSITNSTISGNSVRFGEGFEGGGGSASAALVSAPHRSPGTLGGGIRAKNLVITDSTVSGNFTLGPIGYGGGINADDLTLANSTVSGNYTAGDGAYGGGIFSGTASIFGSMIRGNSTTGQNAGGGGIHIQGSSDSSIITSIVSENFTTGIDSSGGGISVRGSAGGGGIRGALTITDSTISDNSTTGDYAYGGGIQSSFADLTISTSAIYGNSTAGREANGGGIKASARILTIVDSTISSNAATGESASGGGIYAVHHPGRGELNIFRSTITGNRATASGGGIELLYSQLSHTIVSGNWLISDGQPPVADDISGNDFGTELGYNLIGAITGDFTETPGTINYFGIDPLLGPLADNGGPTKTHALLTGSPAIDAGDPAIAAPPSFDQRGNPFRRLADGNGDRVKQIDIGAYEVPMTLVVTTQLDEFDALIEAEVGAGLSLREAMTMANMIPQPINITFALWLNSRTIEIDQTGLGPLPTIANNITIDATNLPGGLTIDAGYGLDGTPETGDGIRVFDIDDGDNENSINAGLFGLTVTGGDVVGDGGGIRSRENLTVVDSSILNNSTRGIPEEFSFLSAGGGISSLIGDLAVIDSTVSGNSTQGNRADGGGIFAGQLFYDIPSSYLAIINSTISGNSTRLDESELGSAASAALVVSAPHTSLRQNGGGIKAIDLVITNSTITGNSTTSTYSRGGGIHANNLVISESTVSGNSTSASRAQGGGIFVSNSLTMTDSTVSGNSTTGSSSSGGGIYARTAFISGSTVSENFTLGERSTGGGIYSRDAIVVGTTISGNYTVGDLARGGGIYSAGENEGLIIRSSTIDNNWTSGLTADGGGIWTREFSIADTTISGNSVLGPSSPRSYGGGGIVTTDFGTITRSTITNNTAPDAGGGIFAGRYFVMSNTIVYGNWITPTDALPIAQDISGFFEAGYSLIGSFTLDFVETPGSVNYVGIDPLLGPLADNGGPTKTHALLFGSPAIDAGDPSIAFDINEFDQRGEGFFRVAGSGINPRIDLGAFESQRIPTADFDSDIRVTGLDFLSWQRGFSSKSAALVDGDADYDRDVDSQDFAVWEALFGLPPRLFLSAELEVANNSAGVSETDEAFSELGEEDFSLAAWT